MIRTNHTRTIGIIIAISLSLVSLGPITFASQAAQAQGNPYRQVVQGFGLSGQIVCPDGQSFAALMDFDATKQSGVQVKLTGIRGTFDMFNNNGEMDGVITDGQVTPSRFDVQGTETTDTICADAAGGGGNPTTVSIKGKCDESATVEFKAANGQRGTFIGEVECSRIPN